MGPSNYFVYRDEGRTFEDIGLWDGTAVSITGTGEPERVQGLLVTDGTLPHPAGGSGRSAGISRSRTTPPGQPTP